MDRHPKETDSGMDRHPRETNSGMDRKQRKTNSSTDRHPREIDSGMNRHPREHPNESGRERKIEGEKRKQWNNGENIEGRQNKLPFFHLQSKGLAKLT